MSETWTGPTGTEYEIVDQKHCHGCDLHSDGSVEDCSAALNLDVCCTRRMDNGERQRYILRRKETP